MEAGRKGRERRTKRTKRWNDQHRTHDAANGQLWQRLSVNHAPESKMAKNVRVEPPTHGARFHFRQSGECADTSPTHGHVYPQTSPLLWGFLWTLLAGLHQRASHVLISQKHQASARRPSAASLMATCKSKSLLKKVNKASLPSPRLRCELTTTTLQREPATSTRK